MGRTRNSLFGESYFTPNSINREAMRTLFTGVPESVKKVGLDLLNSGWRFYVVDQKRGRCYAREKVITIPTWAIHKDIKYKIWYICHEMSHALDKCVHDHGPEFMRILKSICPVDCIEFELGYKPRNAKAAGIGINEELGF